MTLNQFLQQAGGTVWKVVLLIAAIVFIVVFFDYLKRVLRAIGGFFQGLWDSLVSARAQRREEGKRIGTLTWVVLILISLAVAIYGASLVVQVAEMPAPEMSVAEGRIDLPYSAADDASMAALPAARALLAAQEYLSAGADFWIGLALALLGALLLARGLKRRGGLPALLSFGILAALGLVFLVSWGVSSMEITRRALAAGLSTPDYLALLRETADVGHISAAANLLYMRALLMRLRYVILAAGLVGAIWALTGMLSGSVERGYEIRATTGFRGRYSRTITVVCLVIALYVSVWIFFTGCVNILSVITHADGLTEALNDYGSRDVIAIEETVAEAEKDMAKAQGKIDAAKIELEDAQLALESAKSALALNPEDEALQDAVKAAEKGIKGAEKDIKKQTGKVEDAQADKAEAEEKIEEVRANAVTYPARSTAEMFELCDAYLFYKNSGKYGGSEEVVAAMSADLAEKHSLSVDEFTYMASAVSRFNITQGDLQAMQLRYAYLIGGLALLVGLVLLSMRLHVTSLMFKHAFLCLVAFLSVFPFYWIVVSSTNTSMDITLGKLFFGNNLLVNLANASYDGLMFRGFWNSLRNAMCITLLSLIVSSAAGYGFVVYRSKGKETVMKILMLSMMIPQAATLIPLFRLFSSTNLNLLNTMWSVVLPVTATAFLIFMFRQGAQGFPRDLIEAARIDGMGEAGVFVKMFIPVMRPTYAAAATVTFMNAWNAYMWPLIALTDTNAKTMPIYISNMLDGYVMDYGQIMLAVTISTIPTVIIFFLLQKNFVNGILGSVKQ